MAAGRRLVGGAGIDRVPADFVVGASTLSCRRVFFGDDAGASFTAVTQLGTEAAVLVYFAKDIGRIVKAWFPGLFSRRTNADYRMGW